MKLASISINMKNNQFFDIYARILSIILTVVTLIAANSCIVTDSGGERRTDGSTKDNSLSIYENLTAEGIRGGGAGNKPETDVDGPYDIFSSKPMPYNIPSLHLKAKEQTSDEVLFKTETNHPHQSPKESFRLISATFLQSIDFPVSISNSRIKRDDQNQFITEIEIIGPEGSCIGTGSSGTTSGQINLECLFYYKSQIIRIEGRSK